MTVDPDGHWVWLAINAGFAIYDGYKAYKSGADWKGIAWAAGSNFLKIGYAKKASKVLKAVNKSKKSHTVYTLNNSKGEVKYVGRTSNINARKSAHKKSKDKRDLIFTPYKTGLNYAEARGVEHILYSKYGGKNKLLNRINPISSKNPMKKYYVYKGKQVLRKR